mgnify:CR=1 FL=1
MKRIVFLGMGGFYSEIEAVAERNTSLKIVGAVDDVPQKILGYLGKFSWVDENTSNFDFIFPAFGATNMRSLLKRTAIIKNINNKLFLDDPLIASSVIVEKDVYIGSSSFCGHQSVMSVGANIGDYVILNTSSIVGHHSSVGNYSVIGPQVFIGGEVRIGRNCLIGAGAKVMQGVSIGDGASIGMGVTVFKDVPDGKTILPFGFGK